LQYLIILVIVIIIAIALQPSPPEGQPPASLADVDAPTAEQGKPITKVFGTYVVQAPNVVWYGDLSYTAIRKKGGK
jgi:hypothetical protein